MYAIDQDYHQLQGAGDAATYAYRVYAPADTNVAGASPSFTIRGT